MSSTSPLKRSGLPRLADAAAVRASRARLVAVPRLRSRAPKIPFITLVSVILLGGIVGLLLFNTSMQQASFEASSLQDQADLLTAREQALQAETDALDNPDVIQQKAFEHHMVIPPGGNATVNLDKDKVTGDQAPAAIDGALPPDSPKVYHPVQKLADATPPPVPQDVVPTGEDGQHGTVPPKPDPKNGGGKKGDGSGGGDHQNGGGSGGGSSHQNGGGKTGGKTGASPHQGSGSAHTGQTPPKIRRTAH